MSIKQSGFYLQLFSGIALIFLGSLLFWVGASQLQTPIQSVQLLEPEKLLGWQKSQIMPVINLLNQQPFWSVDIKTAYQALIKKPWVQFVHIQRQWPDQVEVKVQARAGVARWKNSGLITEKGIVFAVPKIEAYRHLPILSGPEYDKLKLVQQIVLLNKNFEPLGLQLRQLAFDPAIGWQLKMSNGVQVQIGAMLVQQKLAQLQWLLEKLPNEKKIQIAHLDFRYPNGVAIGWK